MNTSPFILVTRLNMQVGGILSAIDQFDRPTIEVKLIATLKRDLADARLDVRDYELSETRDEQLENAKIAKARLENVRRHILSASEYNIFSAIDVAELTAGIEQICDRLI